jgi:hypothetical protein
MDPTAESDHDERRHLAATVALRSSCSGLLTKLQCEATAGVGTLSGAVPSFCFKQVVLPGKGMSRLA